MTHEQIQALCDAAMRRMLVSWRAREILNYWKERP